MIHDLLLQIDKKRNENRQAPFVAAIDGGSGTGKTTLAERLAEHYACPVIHTDDFFLPREMRTPERLAMPGGNIHFERFLAEVIQPLLTRQPVTYRLFSCKTMDYDGKVTLPAGDMLIVEGSYSLLPLFRQAYSYSIFTEAERSERLRRIALRSGEEKLSRFREEWIPMEDRYFDFYRIKDFCDCIIKTDQEVKP